MSYSLEMFSDDISIKAKFIDTVCVFSGNSGTGKTYLFNKIKADCKINGRKVIIISDNGVDIRNDKVIIDMCKDMEVVMFDRADLYLTHEIVSGVLNSGVKLILVAMKNPSTLNLKKYGSYSVDFTERELVTKRWGL